MNENHIIIIPDSFKGTMTSSEVCGIIKDAITESMPQKRVVTVPIADGGEGSAECFLGAVGGTKRFLTVSGPYFEPTDCFFAVLSDGTAVVESALCSGLPLVEGRRSAADTTTFGVGETIAAAVRFGCEKIILCLGGVATNDGGCGMAAALGVKFYSGGEEFIPVGRTLSKIEHIDVSGAKELLSKVSVTAMCDVSNTLFGERGAAYVFAPQKGVLPGETEMLDAGLRHLSEIIKMDIGTDISYLRGTGAAGGMGGGAVAFLGATLRSGIETVLDAVDFDSLLGDASLVITGEGMVDSQSAGGKAISGVTRRAKAHGVPVICIAGKIGKGAEAVYPVGIEKIYESCVGEMSLEEIRKTCRDDLFYTSVRAINEWRDKI